MGLQRNWPGRTDQLLQGVQPTSPIPDPVLAGVPGTFCGPGPRSTGSQPLSEPLRGPCPREWISAPRGALPIAPRRTSGWWLQRIPGSARTGLRRHCDAAVALLPPSAGPATGLRRTRWRSCSIRRYRARDLALEPHPQGVAEKDDSREREQGLDGCEPGQRPRSNPGPGGPACCTPDSPPRSSSAGLLQARSARPTLARPDREHRLRRGGHPRRWSRSMPARPTMSSGRHGRTPGWESSPSKGPPAQRSRSSPPEQRPSVVGARQRRRTRHRRHPNRSGEARSTSRPPVRSPQSPGLLPARIHYTPGGIDGRCPTAGTMTRGCRPGRSRD